VVGDGKQEAGVMERIGQEAGSKKSQANRFSPRVSKRNKPTAILTVDQ